MKFFSAILYSILLAACSIHPYRASLPDPGHVIEGVDAGDQVDIFLDDGTRHRIFVTRADDLGLHGSNASFAYDEMQAVVVLPKDYSALSALSDILSRGLTFGY